MRLRKVCFDKLRTGLLALLLGAKGIATRSKDAIQVHPLCHIRSMDGREVVDDQLGLQIMERLTKADDVGGRGGPGGGGLTKRERKGSF